MTLDELEKAFLKDAISEADYTEICERSLKQYRAILSDENVARAFVGLEEFKAEWDVRIGPFATQLVFLHLCFVPPSILVGPYSFHASARCSKGD